MTRRHLLAIGGVLLGFMVSMGIGNAQRPGHVLDEARQAGRDAASLPMATEDYFHDMDNAIPLAGLPDGQKMIEGRNMWLVWTGGDDRFWDTMTASTFGAFDLLKIIAYDPQKPIDRSRRWSYLGLINEPCMRHAKVADPQRFGLLARYRAAPAARPTRLRTRQSILASASAPAARRCRWARCTAMRAASWACGCSRIRLLTRRRQNGGTRKDIFRCGLLQRQEARAPVSRRHGVRVLPCRAEPAASARRSRAIRNGAISAPPLARSTCGWTGCSFTARVGTISCSSSCIPTGRAPWTPRWFLTDNINNPRTMNAIYNVGPRLDIARRWGRETLTDGELNNKQFNDYVPSGPLTQYFEKPDTVWTTARAEGWLGFGRHSGRAEPRLSQYRPVQRGVAAAFQRGRRRQADQPDPDCGSRARTRPIGRRPRPARLDMALFFLNAARPDRLKDAPGGAKYLTASEATLDRGKTVFAETCARCHSSKAPTPAAGLDPAGLRRSRLSPMLEPLLGLDQNRRLQAADARYRARAGFPRWQFPLHRCARAGDAAADQCLQPARHQCARRQHLGQFLVEIVQDAAVGRHDHGA